MCKTHVAITGVLLSALFLNKAALESGPATRLVRRYIHWRKGLLWKTYLPAGRSGPTRCGGSRISRRF